MGNYNGNNGNTGNKNSGRKSTRDEFAKNKAIAKAWEKVNEKVEEEDVLKVALPLALRDMTVKSDITSDGKPIYLPAEVINKNDNEEED